MLLLYRLANKRSNTECIELIVKVRANSKPIKRFLALLPQIFANRLLEMIVDLGRCAELLNMVVLMLSFMEIFGCAAVVATA